MDYLDKFVAGVVSLGVAGFLWLIRTVLTNNTKVDMLLKEIEHRESAQKEMRDSLAVLTEDVKGLSDKILDLWKAK